MLWSTRLTAASRGQNTMKHSQVSDIWDVLCPFPARMVPRLHHVPVSCGLALLDGIGCSATREHPRTFLKEPLPFLCELLKIFHFFCDLNFVKR